MEYIDQKGLEDATVYKKAMIDRRHFSKIRSNLNYQPIKSTVMALILALELSLDKAIDFLNSAGYSFTNSNEADLIIKYCIENKIYLLNEVNYALDYFNQPLLRL